MLQPVRGMVDWTPDKYYALLTVARKMSAVAEAYGYRAIETPALEHFEVLKAKAGEEVVNEIYYFRDKAGRELGLRFDMTVPVARVVSYRVDLPKPIRLYYFTKVWRYDEPQFGRFREFHQFGVEHIGSGGVEADAEVIAVSLRALEAVGSADYTAHVSDRRIMDNILESRGVGRSREDVLRILDKRGKVPDEELVKMLMGRGLSKDIAEDLVNIANVNTPIMEAAHTLSELRVRKDLVDYVESLATLLNDYGLANRAVLDLGIVRGLDYYTGFVYEIYVKDFKLAVGGGGRYDDLVRIYSGQDMPATGFAIGVERVMMALNIQQNPPKVDYYIYPISREQYSLAVRISENLRRRGLSVVLDVGKPSLRSALEYASKIGVSKFIIVGPREVSKGVVRVRDMEKWSEVEEPLNNYIG